MMKTAIYIRVSTDEQVKEGYSISAQLQKLKAFCVSQGWEVEGIYADEGISAKDMNRPQLKKMIKDIENEKINCVLVYRLDRLTRSVFDLYKLLETFEKHDCKFKSATEVYDTTTAMGRMFITIVAALAQWERENMGERIAMGQIEKARQGKWTASQAPFGYDLNKDESKLYIKHDEAFIVRKIFDMYRTRGMNQISLYLNNHKMYTKLGRKWTDSTIGIILNNPVYYGYIYWSGEVYKGNHEAIISKEDYDNASKISRVRNTSAGGRAVSSPYIFSRKLKCPECGKSLIGSTTKSHYKGKPSIYRNYRCREKSRGRCNGSRSVSEKRLENAFIEYIDNVDYSDVLNESIIMDTMSLDQPKNNELTIKQIELTLDKIDKRKKKWQYAWSEDIISFDDFKNRMEEESQKEKILTNELNELNPLAEVAEEEVNAEDIIRILKNIKGNWITLTSEQKKELVFNTVKEIHYEYLGSTIVIDSIDFA